ncbi:SDR family oxidoreductase [Pseudonocardia sp. NPDC046786]|uniref:SDR family NAD(P)-dependent oxidoreductase n=1 Tax=Pseudonocardia sp. NPDC046786 TaxID=3155471 RepID=UPI0033BFFBCB
MSAPAGDPGARFRLDGRTAVVTGASAGLGAHFAVLLARAGADLVLGARRVAELEAVADAVRGLGRRCVAVRTDIARVEGCRALVAAAVELGGPDVLVNNAGTGYAARAEDDDPERAARLLETNLLGTLRMCQAAGRAMIDAGRGGSIVNISSALGLSTGTVPQAAYSASKAGLLGLTRDLAQQWSGRHRIRVNTLAPGYVSTDLTAPLLHDEGAHARALTRIRMGRIGEPDELDGPLLLLASDAGSYITGSTLCVDGGWAMH